jgi:hypothetical protein
MNFKKKKIVKARGSIQAKKKGGGDRIDTITFSCFTFHSLSFLKKKIDDEG